MVFDRAYVRPVYQGGKEKQAYLREHHRAKQLLRSLRRVGTTLPVVVCVGGERYPALETELTNLGAILLPIAPVPPPSWGNPVYRNNFHKLRALNLTQYDTVVVMDNDCTVVRNIDHLGAGTLPTPAAACHPRRRYRLCSFNFGVHLLTPSAEAAARLLGTYATRQGERNNGGEQEVWSNFHRAIHELPVGLNAHQGLEMSDDEWRKVAVIHAISGHRVDRLPAFLSSAVKRFEVDE